MIERDVILLNSIFLLSSPKTLPKTFNEIFVWLTNSDWIFRVNGIGLNSIQKKLTYRFHFSRRFEVEVIECEPNSLRPHDWYVVDAVHEWWVLFWEIGRQNLPGRSWFCRAATWLDFLFSCYFVSSLFQIFVYFIYFFSITILFSPKFFEY